MPGLSLLSQSAFKRRLRVREAGKSRVNMMQAQSSAVRPENLGEPEGGTAAPFRSDLSGTLFSKSFCQRRTVGPKWSNAFYLVDVFLLRLN